MFRRVMHVLLVLLLSHVAPSNCGGGAVLGAVNQKATASRIIKARSRDTLRKIARRFGVTLLELVQLNSLGEDAPLTAGTRIRLPSLDRTVAEPRGEVVGKRIILADGYSFEADEVWKDGDEIWFRKGTISQRLPQPISSVKPILKPTEPALVDDSFRSQRVEAETQPRAEISPVTWIYLVGGARFRADEVQENTEGAWYSRGSLSVFIGRERIARIERELPGSAADRPRNHDWSSGNAWIDGLIRSNSARYGLDPYLIFLVMEQESHFRQRAVSPKGAKGLMQLMPATARRFGVRDPFDPVDNIMGGARYLKELMTMFGGRVDLALASYNAGEGAVMKFGRAVPPYKETRNYVKSITQRYGKQGDSSKRIKPPGAAIAQ